MAEEATETPVEEVPIVETPTVEPVVETPAKEPETAEVPALEPGGDRFKQVWARAKTAEADRETLRAELQREREERIRLEERSKVQEEHKAKAEPEYTWDQLEGLIADGKITLGKAAAYREDLVSKRAVEKAKAEMQAELHTTSARTTVASELARYKQAMPEILQSGTPERLKVEREYAYLTQTLGYPGTLATELAATRAALGDTDTVERLAQSKRGMTKESLEETHSSTKRPTAKGPDLVGKLSPREKVHYEKMITNGRYADWNEVKAELEWERPGAKRG